MPPQPPADLQLRGISGHQDVPAVAVVIPPDDQPPVLMAGMPDLPVRQDVRDLVEGIEREHQLRAQQLPDGILRAAAACFLGSSLLVRPLVGARVIELARVAGSLPPRCLVPAVAEFFLGKGDVQRRPPGMRKRPLPGAGREGRSVTS